MQPRDAAAAPGARSRGSAVRNALLLLGCLAAFSLSGLPLPRGLEGTREASPALRRQLPRTAPPPPLPPSGELQAPGRAAFHADADVAAVAPHVFAAAARARAAPLRSVGGVAAAAPPLTPCWTEAASDSDATPQVACLPGFYVLGLPKCGTSVLFEALALHPSVAAPPEKESHFWTAALAPRHVASEAAAEARVREHTHALGAAYLSHAQRAGGAWANIVMGDYSPENFARWGKRKLADHPPTMPSAAAAAAVGAARAAAANASGVWPDYLSHLVALPELLAALQPGARLVVLLREPGARVASAYRQDCSDCAPPRAGRPRKSAPAFCKCPLSADALGAAVSAAAPQLAACVARHGRGAPCGVGAAAFRAAQLLDAPALANAGAHPKWLEWLRDGLYAPPLAVWNAAFPPGALLAVRYESMMAAPRRTLERIFAHIGITTALDAATWDAMEALFAGGAADAARACEEGAAGGAGCDRGLHVSSRTARLLAPDTAAALRRLYAPFNADLAEALGDDSWRWE